MTLFINLLLLSLYSEEQKLNYKIKYETRLNIKSKNRADF